MGLNLNKNILQKVGILPFQMDSERLLCKVRVPGSAQALHYLNYFSQLYRRNVEVEWVDEKTFTSDLEYFQGQPHSVEAYLLDKAVVRKLEQILFEAYDNGASDVHFEPHRNALKVFMRKQGEYQLLEMADPVLQRTLFNCIKLKALLDISDTRHPQNGQFTLSQYQKQVHCRVSTLPGLHGESIVIRLHLPQNQADTCPTALQNTTFFSKLKQITPGLFLITGPIGSGKTTTYYTLLNQFKQQRILSLEDPIEIPQPNVVQLKLSAKSRGEMFMRQLLRQSLNVIGIGEIRTSEHLKLAVNAALTGHCVLATFHASSIADVSHRLATFGYSASQQKTFLCGILFQSWNTQGPLRSLSYQE